VWATTNRWVSCYESVIIYFLRREISVLILLRCYFCSRLRCFRVEKSDVIFAFDTPILLIKCVQTGPEYIGRRNVGRDAASSQMPGKLHLNMKRGKGSGFLTNDVFASSMILVVVPRSHHFFRKFFFFNLGYRISVIIINRFSAIRTVHKLSSSFAQPTYYYLQGNLLILVVLILPGRSSRSIYKCVILRGLIITWA